MRSFVIGLLIFIPSADAQEAKPQTPREQYEALVKEWEAARQAAIKAYGEAKTDREQEEVRFPLPEDFGPRFLELAEENPDDSAAVDALIWIVERGTSAYDSTEGRIGLTSRAMDLLARDHLQDPKVGQACLQAVEYPSPPRDTFLRAISEGAKDPSVRARSCLALAEYLKNKGELVVSIREPVDEGRMARLHGLFGTDYFQQLRDSDPGALFGESERLFERVLAEHADIVYSRGERDAGRGPRTLADVARPDLYELRHLTVGKVAPEIEGGDIDDKPMKLSDQRGKVVVLTFWGTWCGPCMSMVPQERSLVAKHEGKPFALLGINSDRDREHLKGVMEEKKITWRSWWDGGKLGGPIATRWNVKHWPTIYVLDHRGVIRFKLGRESPEGAVDKLMEEMEGSKP